ncbi:MAG: hypothetical protein IPK85_09245 [Gemmatimonadetes bacterium]|nr:hypothetical protein [Gemmatimonadota bacterium]
MLTLVYLVAIVVAYGILSDGMDRAVRRTFHARRAGPQLGLVEEFDVRPDHHTALWRVRRHRSADAPEHPGRPADPGSAGPSLFLER